MRGRWRGVISHGLFSELVSLPTDSQDPFFPSSTYKRLQHSTYTSDICGLHMPHRPSLNLAAKSF